MTSSFLINPFLHSGTQQYTVTLPPLYHKSGSSSYFGMDTFDSLPPPLDSLDSLTITDFKSGVLPCLVMQLYFGSSNYCSYSCWDYPHLIYSFSFYQTFRLCSSSIHSTGDCWILLLIGFFSLHIVRLDCTDLHFHSHISYSSFKYRWTIMKRQWEWLWVCLKWKASQLQWI